MDLKEKILSATDKNIDLSLSKSEVKAKVESIISRTFTWMAVSLLIAFWVGYLIMNLIKNWYISLFHYKVFFWISAIWWFILVFVISWFWEKFSYVVLAVLFIIFAVLEWIWLTWVFLIYTWQSVLNAFLTTSLLFIVLVIMWNVLKFDVTKVGNILLAALIALIIWTIINLFWHNQTFNLWLNIFALVIFSWLVIWDMAILKQMALIGDKRIEIVMALSLYLDFINIFFTLLELFWKKED
jgi:FtsH-binding integral membrane protein